MIVDYLKIKFFALIAQKKCFSVPVPLKCCCYSCTSLGSVCCTSTYASGIENFPNKLFFFKFLTQIRNAWCGSGQAIQVRILYTEWKLAFGTDSRHCLGRPSHLTASVFTSLLAFPLQRIWECLTRGWSRSRSRPGSSRGSARRSSATGIATVSVAVELDPYCQNVDGFERKFGRSALCVCLFTGNQKSDFQFLKIYFLVNYCCQLCLRVL